MTKTVVLRHKYRPLGDGSAEVQAGETIDLPDAEADHVLSTDIGVTPDDSLKSQRELDAVELLTELGYTVTAPKRARAPAPAPEVRAGDTSNTPNTFNKGN